ncbi:MAG: hypothetical protein K2G50_00525, partial [Anaeroplasmataceae bacterium]|nr:hypothetical protein [Anaeroplasmataceae bacterium]
MKKIFKSIYYAMVLLTNMIVAKIPSRHFRKLVYKMLGAKIGRKSIICRNCEMLRPSKLRIGRNVAVGWRVLFDSRGGITIGNNVNISSDTQFITGSHEVNDPQFKSKFKPIKVEDNTWI